MSIFRWFPELSTSYSRLNFGNHTPLPQFKDKHSQLVKDSQFVKIKSGPGTFLDRYNQTLQGDVAQLLDRVPIRKRNGTKFVDKERPGPGYDRSKKDKISPHLTDEEPQLVLYVFEPASLREGEHPKSLASRLNRERIKQTIPEPWKNRTLIKFIPNSKLSQPNTHLFDTIASEVFRSVSYIVSWL